MDKIITTETFDCIKKLNLRLNNSQVVALGQLIEDIGIYNFERSHLKEVLLKERRTLNEIRGAWVSLKNVNGRAIKDTVKRRLAEVQLWQKV
jgi:hypothetical protein